MNFIIPGEPCGKGRAKFARRGNFVSTYTPDKTILYENLVKACFVGEYTEKPLSVEIFIYHSIPKSTPKKYIGDMLKGKIRPTKKPDIDNICKVILDALNGVAYKDDTQVYHLEATKRYGEIPSVEVYITEYAE
jgi:Holliday junction resolvase RusA-like endonuclease